LEPASGHMVPQSNENKDIRQCVSLKEFAPTTNCTFPALNEDQGRRRADKAFGDGIRDHDINWQLLL
jgi:hypothetical protein